MQMFCAILPAAKVSTEVALDAVETCDELSPWIDGETDSVDDSKAPATVSSGFACFLGLPRSLLDDWGAGAAISWPCSIGWSRSFELSAALRHHGRVRPDIYSTAPLVGLLSPDRLTALSGGGDGVLGTL